MVPDFRLNKSFDKLKALSQHQKDKVEFLCNECCWFGCADRKKCYETVSRKIWEWIARSIIAWRLIRGRDIFFEGDGKSGIYRSI